jgi:chromosome segregation ATPase
MTMKVATRWVIGFVAIICCVMALPSAQSPNSEPPPGTADLLAEVRGLRAELNQFATASIRAQLFMGRLQLQEHRIQLLSQQIMEAQAELEKSGLELSHWQADLDEFNRGEHPIQRQRGDPDHEKIVTIAGQEMRTNVDRRQRRIQELRNREADLSGQLAAEQGRWSEFNARLDALDASLPTMPR